MIFIMMVTGTNLVPQIDHAVEYMDGHWDQFGTTDDHAIEVQSDFDNDGHWDQFGTIVTML